MSTLKVNKLRDTSGSADAITLDPNGGAVLAGVTTVSTVKVGSGVTISSDGDVFHTGVCTATKFVGDAASLTSIPAANIVGVATAGLTKTGGFGSLTLLSTTTVTSEVTTVTIENSFDAYDLYLLIADRLSCTVDTRDLHAYIRDDNNITGDYSMKIYGTSIDYNYGDSQGTMRFQYNSIGNEVSGGHVQDDYYMYMYMGGFEANRTWRAWGSTCYGDGSDPGNVAGQSFAVRVMRSAAITGIRFFWQSGDFRADSQFKLYGVG